jgi:hypothetical protein
MNPGRSWSIFPQKYMKVEWTWLSFDAYRSNSVPSSDQPYCTGAKSIGSLAVIAV